jgi:hypothetical protein
MIGGCWPDSISPLYLTSPFWAGRVAISPPGGLFGGAALLERALAIREKALGPEHPEMATSLNNLASLLQDQGGRNDRRRRKGDAGHPTCGHR